MTYVAAPDVVCYWEGTTLVVHEPVGGQRHAVTPLAVALMHACRQPQPFSAVRAAFPGLAPATVRRTLGELTAAGLVHRARRPADATIRDAARGGWWGPWSPVASFFHYATRDVRWASGHALETLERGLDLKVAVDPPPPPVKAVRSLGEVALPRVPPRGEFRSVLLERRTWRGFSTEPLALAKIAELLDLTFGVRGWVGTEGGERLALKTSPSGGGRHPIEAYLLAHKVRGLRKGLYHYAPDTHRLALIRRGASQRQIEGYLADQWWYREAAAVVLMTAVLPRVWWRYGTPRAYRSVLLDAGHVCQTFCLVATALELAPFCTMALADSRVERALGIDGVTEVVLYAAGVGHRPPGGYVQWPRRPKGRTYLSPDTDPLD